MKIIKVTRERKANHNQKHCNALFLLSDWTFGLTIEPLNYLSPPISPVLQERKLRRSRHITHPCSSFSWLGIICNNTAVIMHTIHFAERRLRKPKYGPLMVWATLYITVTLSNLDLHWTFVSQVCRMPCSLTKTSLIMMPETNKQVVHRLFAVFGSHNAALSIIAHLKIDCDIYYENNARSII